MRFIHKIWTIIARLTAFSPCAHAKWHMNFLIIYALNSHVIRDMLFVLCALAECCQSYHAYVMAAFLQILFILYYFPISGIFQRQILIYLFPLTSIWIFFYWTSHLIYFLKSLSKSFSIKQLTTWIILKHVKLKITTTCHGKN